MTYNLDLCIAIDVSGSAEDDIIQAYLAYVHSTVKNVMDVEIKVIFFDNTICNVVDFTNENIDDMVHIPLETIGGGGTVVGNVYTYLRKNSIKPKLLNFFTDGFVYEWGDSEYCPTLFTFYGEILSGNVEPPYGMMETFNAEY